MASDAGVLTVEYKINLLAPAAGERIRALGEVVRPGRTLTVCRGRAIAESAEGAKVVAEVQATIMAIADRPDVRG